MISKGMLDFESTWQVFHLHFDVHGCRHSLRKLTNGVWLVGSDVEHLTIVTPVMYGIGYDRRNIRNVAESSRLRAVAKDRERLPPHCLIHEDPNYVSEWICKVLSFAIDVVGSEYDEGEAE